MIIIAHRLSTIAKSDYLYVFENGKIVEKGNYNKLKLIKNSKLSEMLESNKLKIFNNAKKSLNYYKN